DAGLSSFLAEVNQRLGIVYDQESLALLENELRGPHNMPLLTEAQLANEKLQSYVKSLVPRVAKFKRLHLGDALQRRQLDRVPRPGYEALNGEELQLLYALAANMSDSYHRVKLCAYRQPHNCTLRLIPEVQSIVQHTKNLEEIEYYWHEWRRRTGLPVRSQFVSFWELYKKAAKLNGFERAEDYWFRQLELTGQQSMGLLTALMAALQPLFVQFHAHVRGSLRKLHGERLVPRGQPYPQHLAEVFLGKAFRRAQLDWFVDAPDAAPLAWPNITDALHRRGLSNTQRVFWNVAEYYRSLGLPQLEGCVELEDKENHLIFQYICRSLWDYAQPVASRNEDDCWHKAWRFHARASTNFSYCPLNDEERFFSMFETQCELYCSRAAAAAQPILLREEPFPNFVDALGKCFSLAATSPRYLRRLGLLQGTQVWSLDARLNRMYLQGLRVVFLLPVFYVLDRYRVEVLSGRIRADDNEAYWRLTELYTGAAPPHQRSNAQFDVPAKLLMEVDDQYTSQFLSIVLQFQLYKHFCSLTGQFVKGSADKPLDLCDLSDQREIGPILMRAMSLGSSVHHREVLQQLLGTSELSLDGLLSYFKPLQDWLTQQNRERGLDVGWQ
ncbi:hypothetical protein KR222_002982, partial [Zaprionus bogoriensis]